MRQDRAFADSVVLPDMDWPDSATGPAGLTDRALSAIGDQQARLFLWVPVCLIAGVSVYFALPVEPHLAVFAIAALIAAALAWKACSGRAVPACLALALVSTGFALGKARTEWVAGSALAASTGQVQLAGWVTQATMTGASRARVVIDVDRISRIRRAAWPSAVQLTLFKLKATPRVGEYVQAKARLFPLITPVAPGAYDYGRVLWFKGIGATGRGVLATDNERSASLPDRWSWHTSVAGIRQTIGKRIRQAMPAGLAAFAEALITGNRAQIKPRLREQLSIAGLAHVLAISGLHMTLVAGGIFWLVRSLLALSPAMALHWPIKKLAAIAALIAAAGYLLISGGAVSTQRAFIMLSVMFIAILFDRPAISLRNLAIAATVIVVSAPESVLSAGFQMSFMAVMGLIATYEALRERRGRQPKKAYSRARPQRIWRWITSRVLAIALTTLIASLFTGLPAAYHFNRVAPLGVIANLLALPVVSLLVMPMAVLATALMPLGLEGWPLWLMGQGLHWVTGVAHWVAGLPGASFAAATLPAISAVCFGFAAIWLCLWTGRLRWLAAAPAALGVLMSANVDRPDILIERTGKNVAYRGVDGRLLLADARKAKYAARKWLLRDGDDAELADAVKRQGWRCGNDKCIAATATGTIVYLQEGAIIPDDCFQANIVISQFPLRGACRNVPVRIDRFDLWRSGAHAIYFAAGGAKIVTTKSTRGQRPWTITPVARRKIRLDPYAQN